MSVRIWNAIPGVALALAVGVAAGSNISPLRHAGHEAHPIPDSWTDAQVAEFIANSDRLIDEWAGRKVAPGEKVTQDDGLVFTKSTPEMIAQRQCRWCPRAQKCH